MRKEICEKIGQFYLQKNNGDYNQTEAEILMLGIQNIFENNTSVTIILGQPGRLIGPRGKNIEDLQKYLKKDIRIFESSIPNINDFLVPIKETEYDEY